MRSDKNLENAVKDLADAIKADDSVDHWHYLISKVIQRGTGCELNEACKTATKLMNDIFEIET